LQAVQIIRGALRMGGGAEYRPLVILQHRDPRCDIGGVIFPKLRREFEIGAKKRCAKLGDKLLDGVTFIAETLAAEIAVEPRRVTSPMTTFMAEKSRRAGCSRTLRTDRLLVPIR
jgi:hypothetical protein